MRTLPDAPSLDHLRGQAKDLLVQLRLVQPGAKLSDAQALVAEQYGYRTWPDLKAEVDRRSADVRTTDDSLAAAVAATFALGSPTGPLVAYERQWAGQAWTLETDRGRWLARQLSDWFNEGAIEPEALLADSAAAAGIVTPRPVRSPSGAVVETVHDARWRVYDLPPLGPEPSLPADPRHAAAAGRILGRVHALRLPAPHPVAAWLTCVRSEARWWELHRMAEVAGATWSHQLADVIPVIVEVSGIVEHAASDEAAVLSACHYAPNAFRVIGPDDLAVLSWEHAGATPPRWDLGATLAGWSRGAADEVNATAAHALWNGYAREAALPDPLDLGIFSAWVCAGLNWLASRIRIALEEDDVERRETAARAVPWLLARPPSRPWLEALLAAVTT